MPSLTRPSRPSRAPLSTALEPTSPSRTDSQPELGPSASTPAPPTHSRRTARVHCSLWKVHCSPAVPSASAPTCSRAKYAYREEDSIPVDLHVLDIENMPHDVADNLTRATQIRRGSPPPATLFSTPPRPHRLAQRTVLRRGPEHQWCVRQRG